MWVLVVLAAVACSVGSDTANNSSFGSATMTPSSTVSSATMSTTNDDEGNTQEASSESDPPESGSTTEVPETSGLTTGTTSGTSSAGTGTEQPPDGMYSACESAADCFGLTACQNGFCTRMCADPLMDCDPAPGGNASPVCFMFETMALCALDCGGGETCPTPMMCTAVSGGSVCS